MVVKKIKELKKGMCVCILRTLYIDDGYLNEYGKVERDVYSALDGADALVLMTPHREFRDQSHASGGRVQHFGWTILG